jgi:sarcosine/dimethylglycine N-methyltransferase
MADFESLGALESGSIDVVMSSDSFVYCQDREKMMDEMARIVAPGGVVAFTDYLRHPEAEQADVQEVCDRLKFHDFGTLEAYAARLAANGLQKIVAEESPENIIRHYGYIHHCAATLKREQLLADGCSPAFLEMQKKGMRKWVETGLNRIVTWGWCVFKKLPK